MIALLLCLEEINIFLVREIFYLYWNNQASHLSLIRAITRFFQSLIHYYKLLFTKFQFSQFLYIALFRLKVF